MREEIKLQVGIASSLFLYEGEIQLLMPNIDLC